jgi:hypothetical protein
MGIPPRVGDDVVTSPGTGMAAIIFSKMDPLLGYVAAEIERSVSQ